MSTKKAFGLTEDKKFTGKMTFTFDDGTVQEFDVANVNEETKERAMYHGFSQKLGDSYASASAQENPLAFAKQVLADTIKQLYAGDWRATVASGPRVTDLATALARVTGKTLDECVAFTETLDDDQKKVWRAKGKIKSALATIAAEKAVAKATKLAAQAAGGEEEKEEEITLS